MGQRSLHGAALADLYGTTQANTARLALDLLRRFRPSTGHINSYLYSGMRHR